MYLLPFVLGVVFVLACWLGFRRIIRFEHLNERRVLNTLITGVLFLTVLNVAHWTGYLTQETAAKITMGLYILAAGFLAGFGTKLVSLRSEAGPVEYLHRSFWTDAAPNLIAILIVAFGIYRTGMLTFGPFTGIGITSGLSLIFFGYWGWTISIVPEFRRNGILLLDQFVAWDKVTSYRWESEEVLQIDYYTSDSKLTDFNTYIPAEDCLLIEQLLGKKLKEYEEERKERIHLEDEI